MNIVNKKEIKISISQDVWDDMIEYCKEKNVINENSKINCIESEVQSFIIDCIKLRLDNKNWEESEKKVAEIVGGTLAKKGQMGYDVITPQGIRIQVKNKEKAFDENGIYRPRKPEVNNLEFDILAVVFRDYDNSIRCIKQWTVDEVKKLTQGKKSLSFSVNRKMLDNAKDLLASNI